MTEDGAWTCPLCGREAGLDERPPAEIAGLEFRSIVCDQPPRTLTDHPFAVRWLEAQVADKDEVDEFRDRFVFVRGPLPEGTPIAQAFGDTDPIRAWIEEHPAGDEGIRILIRI